MPTPYPQKITLSTEIDKHLKKIASSTTQSYRIVRRAKIILEASRGRNNSFLAEKYDLSRSRVRDWRKRWQDHQEKLEKAEEEGIKEDKIEAMLIEILEDKPRSGKPATYTLEQVVQIISVACEEPEQSERPTSHWSQSELATEVNKRGITLNISPRSVGRFLKRSQSSTSPL